MTLTAITLPPATGVTPEKLLIILHGWGADAQDLAPLGAALELSATQVILPNAPFNHFQVPGGRAWYALERPDYAGYPSAREQLQNWLIQLPQTTH
ncbi:MAG: alpha/beta hydrolase, partial [Cyanobacteria bacterium P01_H01_bin.15]